MISLFRKLTFLSISIAFIMSLSGAYARLTGFNLDFPEQTYNADNFQENIHHYATALFSLLILVLAGLSWWQPKRVQAVGFSVGVLFLTLAQVFLGSLTAQLHGMPIIIAGHVMLAMLTVWTLTSLLFRSQIHFERLESPQKLRYFAQFSMLVLFAQIFLGIWLSVNHAGASCLGFPKCNGQWIPNANYTEALRFFNGLVSGYAGYLQQDAQIALSWLHRVSTVLTFIVLSWLAIKATEAHRASFFRKSGLWLNGLLFLHIAFSIVAIKLNLPAWTNVIHHGLAISLMLPLIAISFFSAYSPVAFEKFTESDVETVRFEKPIDKIEIPPKTDEIIYVEPELESLYSRLKNQLKKTRSGLGYLFGQKAIDEQLFEDLESSLLIADVGMDTTTFIMNQLTEKVEKQQLSDANALSVALKQELFSILEPCSINLTIPKQDKPFVILVVGVNGAGKTTTIGKLANRLQAQGHSVMLAAGDTFRAAAVEQLQTWGERNHIHVVAQHTGADSASVIYDAVQSAQAKGIDVLIADTAGRLQTKSNLMDELKKVKRIMSRLDETAPHEVLLVLDAGTGQNAVSQTKLFDETVGLTGLVLTKLDGTAKGGVIFALAKQFRIPIRYIGIGEGIEDLQDFNAEKFVNALFIKD